MPEKSFELLSLLEGTFEGEGEGQFPTIEPFRYFEKTCFINDLAKEFVQYEQRTFLLPDHTPTHWETGFIFGLEKLSIDLVNSQNNGRLEKLRGELVETSNGFEVELENILFGNDDRMLRAKRVLKLEGDELFYELFMSTTTTPTPEFLPHLKASLKRVRR